VDPWLTSRIVVAVALALCVTSVVVAGWKVWNWRHHRRWRRPLHRRLAPVVGMPMAGPMRHITIPRDRSWVRVKFPQEFAPDGNSRADVVRIVAEAVGIEAPEAEWRKTGPDPMVTVTTSKPPPDRVTLADLMPAVRQAKPDE